jgi:hypothetical protein
MKDRARAFYLSIGVLLLMAMSPAAAATLSTNVVVLLGSNSGHNLSVYPGKAAYDGSSSGVLGDGTVLDYRFFNNTTISSGGYANGLSTRLSDATTSGGLTDYNMDYADVWTTSDPGTLTAGIPDFSTTADFGGATKTMSGQQYVDSTADISGLGTGTVYVLCGHYNNSFTVEAIMSGSGQTPITNTTTVVPPSTRNKYLVSFDFDDPTDVYDTISVSYSGAAGNRARYMGVILDGEAPAGSLNWSSPVASNITATTADVEATIDGALTEAVLVWDTVDQGTGSTNDWSNKLSLGAQAAGVVTGQLAGLSSDTAYFWRIYGIDAGLNEAWTLEQPIASGMSASENPSFTNSTFSGLNWNIEIGWQDNSSYETSFILSRSTNGTDFTTVALLPQNTVAYTDTVSEPGLYTYRLAATNGLSLSGTDPADCEVAVNVGYPFIYYASATKICAGSDFDLSLFAGKSAYEGNGNSGVLGEGTVVGYRFYNDATLASGGYLSDPGNIVSTITYSGSHGNNTSINPDGDLWTTTDPGALTSGIPDWSTSADIGGASETLSSAYNVSGTIDISGFVSGTAYMLIGGLDTPFTATMTMSGSGVSDAVAAGTVDPAFDRNVYLFAFPFKDAGEYDSIAFDYTGSTGSRSVFMGVAVQGTSSSSALIYIIR